ncbi:hypothetical protein TYM08_P0606 [Marinicellulosiphila megalodicopiae]
MGFYSFLILVKKVEIVETSKIFTKLQTRNFILEFMNRSIFSLLMTDKKISKLDSDND